MIDQLSYYAIRIAFVGSFATAGLAILEKAVNLLGFTLRVLGGTAPSRLLEYAAILLLFVVALELREIKHLTRTGRPD